MLIDHFGDTLCFTYHKDRRKLQMFYSTDIKCTDLAEKLCLTDTIKVCVERLRDECYKFEFHLEGTCNSAEDCNISYETCTASRPQSWERFFNILFPHRTKSLDFQHKCDTIFQIIHYVIQNGKKHNPFHVGLAELFHADSIAKLVIEILNKIGWCISYDELQRIDFGLMKRVMNAIGANRVHVSMSINKRRLIRGAMDNFDHTEVTSSGIGGSHGTILMLFQNQNKNANSPKALSKKPTGSPQNQKSLDKILSRQELIKIGKFGGRGKIPETFSPGVELDLSWKKNEFAKQYRLLIWLGIKTSLPLTMDLTFNLLQQLRAYSIHQHILLLSVPSH